MNLGDAALGIASTLGWSVFPCQPGSKRPATRRGVDAATTDLELIGRWWQRCPRFNIGVSCGLSGLLVVDCDVKHDVDGLAAWLELGSQNGPWPDTLVVSTASGGEHWWFRIEPGWDIRNSAGRLAPGIDTRARGGYVVAPPSIVGESSYDVLSDHPVAATPEWLIGLLVDPVAPRAPLVDVSHGNADSYGQAALESELGRLAVALDGTRNETLVRCAFRLGQLVGGGQLDAADVTSQLLAVALRIGLSTREAERTIRSGLEAGLAKPRRAA